MAGWHLRAWRRVRLAPGVTVNLGKTGASLSLGPRGSKVTFGRHGVRQTIGLPGTGLYATRQLSEPRSPVPSTPSPATPSPATPSPAVPAVALVATNDQVEIYYGLATVVGALFGIALLVLGVPSGQAFVGGLLAIAVGIAYEGLAHHHPGPAKVLVQVAVGVAAVVAVVLGVLLAAAAAGALASAGSSRRRR